MKPDTPLHATDAGRELTADTGALLAGGQLPRALFDGLPGLAYLARADRARTIELASAGGHELLGFAPDQESFSLAPLIHPDDCEQVLELIASAMAGNHRFAIEYRLRHTSGDWRTVWDQGQPLR